MNKILLSSNNMDYETPQWLFDELDKEFSFDVDICADKNNHKCDKYATKEMNCLRHSWGHVVCFMNPPYGRKISLFIKKAYEESLKGSTVVCLIPSRTDTKWWWDYCLKAIEIRFLKGRLKFGVETNSAPFPSAIVIFKGYQEMDNNPFIRWVNYGNRKTNK